jgi:hypothetical protein
VSRIPVRFDQGSALDAALLLASGLWLATALVLRWARKVDDALAPLDEDGDS